MRQDRPSEPRVQEPEIAEDVDFRQLAKEARERLRGLSKENAERVGEHLVMAGRLLDVDPELAYQHTQAAVRRGGRIDVVREAAGIAAYATGRYAEALRELRTVRRLNGSSEHLPIMADAERGLGRPERAIALAATPEADTLHPAAKVELALVVSGARSDLGEHDAALVVLDKLPPQQGDLALRVLAARAAALEAAGREDEAAALLATVDPEDLERATGNALPEDDVVVYDVYDDEADMDADEELDADEEDEDLDPDHTDVTDDEGLSEDEGLGDEEPDADATDDEGLSADEGLSDVDAADEGLSDADSADEAEDQSDGSERERGDAPADAAADAAHAEDAKDDVEGERE